MKSNPERKHLLLRKRRQGGQGQQFKVRESGFVPTLPNILQSRWLLFIAFFPGDLPSMVTIYPCFSEEGSRHSSASPQMSTSLIPLLQTEHNETSMGKVHVPAVLCLIGPGGRKRDFSSTLHLPCIPNLILSPFHSVPHPAACLKCEFLAPPHPQCPAGVAGTRCFNKPSRGF